MVWTMLVAAGLLAACGGSASVASSPVYIELGTGDSAIYLVSANLDPAKWPVDANFHSGDLDPSSWPDNVDFDKVPALPSGLWQLCKYTTSHGVTYTVWETASVDSYIAASAMCRVNGAARTERP